MACLVFLCVTICDSPSYQMELQWVSPNPVPSNHRLGWAFTAWAINCHIKGWFIDKHVESCILSSKISRSFLLAFLNKSILVILLPIGKKWRVMGRFDHMDLIETIEKIEAQSTNQISNNQIFFLILNEIPFKSVYLIMQFFLLFLLFFSREGVSLACLAKGFWMENDFLFHPKSKSFVWMR